MIVDGFWLPKKIRRQIINDDTDWVYESYQGGRPAQGDKPDSVSVRWPRFTQLDWRRLISLLSLSRTPARPDFFNRLQVALTTISERFTNPNDPLTIQTLEAIPAYTGYSPGMIRFTLGAMDLMPISSLEEITRCSLPNTILSRFEKFSDSPGLKGRVRFFGSGIRNTIHKLLPGSSLFSMHPNYPDMVLGYAAGNVIGTSHLITLLAQGSALICPGLEPCSRKFPIILVKNSRQEPIFSPLLFNAIEDVDPLLVSSLGIMIWDYEDSQLQEYLISMSDLVLAAAADFTIDAIGRVIHKTQKAGKPVRFHRHGHKISFSTISSDYLEKKQAPMMPDGIDLIHLTSLLSAVDSIYWDQNGCLSSRIHFVERGDSTIYDAVEYGKFLAEKIRLLSTFLPRGDLPLHNLHSRFDKYAALSLTGKVHLCSTYEDDFLIVVDERPWSKMLLTSVINDCVERTIIVRPVDGIEEVPKNYLKWLPKKNLQTLSVAIDGPELETWSARFSRFAHLVGERGVTGIRPIGRGPFPQLSYSWDGYLPLDLSMERAEGYFTTVEFENNYQQVIDTYQLYTTRRHYK